MVSGEPSCLVNYPPDSLRHTPVYLQCFQEVLYELHVYYRQKEENTTFQDLRNVSNVFHTSLRSIARSPSPPHLHNLVFQNFSLVFHGQPMPQV